MIRLRIEKEVKTFSKEGLVFYKGGRPYQVVIEQLQLPEEDGVITSMSKCWVPVEVIDEH